MRIRHIDDPSDVILRATNDSRASLWHVKEVLDASNGAQEHNDAESGTQEDTLGDETVGVQNTDLSRIY